MCTTVYGYRCQTHATENKSDFDRKSGRFGDGLSFDRQYLTLQNFYAKYNVQIGAQSISDLKKTQND